MKIGIYPGSFDPIHKGHIKIINKIIGNKMVDKILIVPTGDYWNKKAIASIDHRINMVSIYETNNIAIEKKDNLIKATYDFLITKKKEFENDDLWLIIGGDNIENIERWINYRELLSYPFIIIGRDAFDKDYINTKLKSLNKNNYVILDTENIDISSTQIREAIKKGRSTENLLDKGVYDYIIKNNLYK